MAGRTSYDRAVERGITQRHESQCGVRDGKRCTCRTPAFIAAAMVDGERRRSPTLRTREAAHKWRIDALAGKLPATPPPASSPELREAWRTYIRACEAGVARTRSGTSYKPRVIADYDSAVSVHVLDRIGGVPLDEVNSVAVQKLLDDLVIDGVSPSRQHAVATALRAMTRWFSRRGVGQRVVGLELPRVLPRRPVVLGPREVADLIALVDDPRARLFGALAAFTGARATEIAALETSDIDRETRTIRLAVREDARKSDAALRTVPIIDCLSPHLDGDETTSGPLFGDGPLRARYDRMYLATRKAWVNVNPRPTPHTLRHNYISWMLAAGVPLPAAQRLSGHETPLVSGVTLAVYGHAMPGHVEWARATLNQWVEEQV